ncbi:MAG TPA: FkbM family methyltransferase [Polyangiaceae bacterium]|nr:FkbM family methyltransferase [Polyangiaceae bacterium]
MASTYDHPLEMLQRYLTGSGRYPFTARVKTPTGLLRIPLYSHHDLLTVNEIFCRKDYQAPEPVKRVVDFGSNIGISALYFLSNDPSARVHLFEPVPANVQRLRQTLQGYEARYHLHPVAIGVEDGEVEFGLEPTGRYGGIGQATTQSIRVPCCHVNTALAEIFQDPFFDQIDVLKIDIEGFEAKVVRAIAPEHLARIRNILAEIETEPPRLAGFDQDRYGPIVRWRRVARASQ